MAPKGKAVSTDWRQIAAEWVARSAGLRHGEIETELRRFAADKGKSPVSIRRYAASAAFVDRLFQEIAKPGTNHHWSSKHIEAIRRMPAAEVAALQRISHLGSSYLIGFVQRVVDERLKGDALKKVEMQIRRDQGLLVRNEAAAAVYRLRSPSYRRRALTAVRKWHDLAFPVTVWAASPLRLEPLVIDAIGMSESPRKYSALRVLAAAAGSSVRPRVAEAVVAALAAGRIFDYYYFIVEDASDAETIKRHIYHFGQCGLGVMVYNPETDNLHMSHAPDRGRNPPPDLARNYSKALKALFPLVSTSDEDS